MKLVFIHGRSQGEKSEAELMKDWGQAFDAGLRKAGLSRPPDLEIDLPFYGKTLDDLTARAAQGLISIIERGESGTDAEAGEFEALLLRSIANAAEISEDEIRKSSHRSRQPRAAKLEWVQALGRVISRRLPWFGRASASAGHGRRRCLHLNQAIRRRSTTRSARRPGRAMRRARPLARVDHRLLALDRNGRSGEGETICHRGLPTGIDVTSTGFPRPSVCPRAWNHWLNAVTSATDRASLAAGSQDVRSRDREHHGPRQSP